MQMEQKYNLRKIENNLILECLELIILVVIYC